MKYILAQGIVRLLQCYTALEDIATIHCNSQRHSKPQFNPTHKHTNTYFSFSCFVCQLWNAHLKTLLQTDTVHVTIPLGNAALWTMQKATRNTFNGVPVSEKREHDLEAYRKQLASSRQWIVTNYVKCFLLKVEYVRIGHLSNACSKHIRDSISL